MTRIEKIVLATIAVLLVVVVVSMIRVKRSIDRANPRTMIEEFDTKKAGEWLGEKTRDFREGFESTQ